MTDTEMKPKTLAGEWYKPICHHCPYFVNESERIDMFGVALGVRCERPDRFDCLGMNDGVRRIAMHDALKSLEQIQRLANVDTEGEVKNHQRKNFNSAKRHRRVYKRKK